MNSDFMKQALNEAKMAYMKGEVPVGAVIVRDGEVIASSHNMRIQKRNALSHAEIECINDACKYLRNWRLDDCDMYVTLEPCPMCAGAIINARIRKLVFGAYDQRAGCIDSVVNLCDLPFNHKPEIYGGIMEDQCKKLMEDFFNKLR